MELHIYSQNVRGLTTKIRECKINSSGIDADIYLLTETNINDSVFSNELFDPNHYNVFRRDRANSSSSKKDGGGVLIAVRSKFKTVPQTKWFSDAEDVWITLYSEIPHFKLHLCCVYLPPKDDNARVLLTSKIQSILHNLAGDPVIIYGD
ncbi:hypothetical protein JTB14_024060 [Gonioctena quinquepunctata]|nr:hypothetical protein JTB14_024060 [Gonioctena quinquepunctata]